MQDPSIELLNRTTSPTLAGAIRERKGEILLRLDETVRQHLPKADELTFTQLRDHLPETLDRMATAIGGPGTALTALLVADGQTHGAVRYHQSYNLSELLIEYSLLRLILTEEVSAALERPMTVDELAVVNAGVDAASRQAVEAFVRHQAGEVQASAEAQSKYLSFLSHDLRGGLNGILLMLEVLKRELAREPQFAESVQDLDLVRRSILETVNTMDRFLHAERFRKGKVEVKLGPVALAALLNEVLNPLFPAAKEKGIDVSVTADEDGTIVSDRNLLQLIVQNLVSNAIKYSSRGTVRLVASPLQAGGTRISVSDEGPGIAADKLSNLFKPFTRGDTHGQSGTGLGLSIARQAADLLQAKLWAESELSQGSTFFLELPDAH